MESILLSTIRRIYSKFRFPAGCLLYALVAFGLWYYGTHSTGPSDFRQGKWEKIELPFERDIASTSISPDGSRFAIIKFDSFAHSKGYFLELHNVNTSSVDRTL